MTAQAKDPTLAMRCPSPLVLFGIDNRGKPKGARFGKEHASLAMKAATQLQLKVLASNDPKVAEIAARLPVGRVHATGRTFVPFIRRDLYDKLVAAAANGNAHPTSPPNGSSGASGSTPGGSAPHLPQNWQEIGIGDLVVANQESLGRLVRGHRRRANGDMFTLRWRDYPRERRIAVRSHDHGLARSNQASRRLDDIPGVGPALATALVGYVARPESFFRSGRNFSAWIGIVPKQHSSGGKDRLGSISKRGDRYLRSLFVAGALAVIRYAKIHGTRHRPWLGWNVRPCSGAYRPVLPSWVAKW